MKKTYYVYYSVSQKRLFILDCKDNNPEDNTHLADFTNEKNDVALLIAKNFCIGFIVGNRINEKTINDYREFLV